MRPIQFRQIDGRPARQCSSCGIIKPFDDFYWDSRREKPWARCCDCYNAAKRRRYVRRIRADLWTPEEIAALRRAKDVLEAAALTGRTVNACRRKAGDLGIRIPKRTSPGMLSKWADTPLEAAIIEAADRRISFSAIAKRHGVTRNTVAGIVWRWRKRRRP